MLMIMLTDIIDTYQWPNIVVKRRFNYKIRVLGYGFYVR